MTTKKTLAEKHTTCHWRCDNCGGSVDQASPCWCGCTVPVRVFCLDCDDTHADVLETETQTRGTLLTFKDGSTFFKSNSGW